MQIAPEVRELQELAANAQIPITRALAKAGVANSTYWRWCHEGKDPKAGSLRKVRAAIRELAEG
jgi:hypothetical protein